MEKRKLTEFDEIILGCSKNQRSSQNALYRLFYPYAMSIAIRYVNSESEAISIVNDTFLKVFSNIKKYNPAMEFKPWFRKILVNTAINFMKKEEKYKHLLSIENANDKSVSAKAIGKLTYDELLKLLQSLSIAYRTVFNLYVIEGYAHKEIADQLGITESTSRSNLVKARIKLKELLAAKQINNGR